MLTDLSCSASYVLRSVFSSSGKNNQNGNPQEVCLLHLCTSTEPCSYTIHTDV